MANDSRKPHDEQRNVPIGISFSSGNLMAIQNDFFGGTIGVTGLLTSADVAKAIADIPDADRIVLPDVMLSRGKFLDGGTVAALPKVVEVVATHGAALVEAITR